MQMIKQKLWNLTMKDADIETYMNRFKDLATLCPSFVTP